MRLRDLGITIGSMPVGPNNAITDVAGVRVGHSTIVEGNGALSPGNGPIRTGVTVIEPRPELARDEPVFAGTYTLNGNGEMTGVEWVREAGVMTTPIAITNTHSVGTVRDALVEAELRARTDDGVYWSMPIVAETFDGALNDINGQHVKPHHVFEALATAKGGTVAEGSVGGGTGMICYEFKGGIGTSSRVIPEAMGGFTVAALVQANHGIRERMCVDGYPVGRHLSRDTISSPWDQLADRKRLRPSPGAGSIIIVLATDAPLLPHQCTRLAKRAANGLARTGGGNEDPSGDIFIAFATGNTGIPRAEYLAVRENVANVRMVNGDVLTQLFMGAVEAVEEAIINAITAAETMVGCDGITAHGLTAPELLKALGDAGWRRDGK